jgi:predicted lipid-binding transport protein (Tim44 family)
VSSTSVASTSTSAPAQQSTAAAVANRAGVVGAVAGGLLAGLALA